ncbi:MAG: M20/M25/M40 family metallo-hydrolase, partial [Lysinibacillus sp.]
MESIDYFNANMGEIIDDIKMLVKADSPSTNKELAEQCKEVLQSLFKTYFGKKAHEFSMDMVGNHLKFSYGGEQPQVLLVGHYDTVWERGKIRYRETEDKIYGPGILDMKASLISAIWCIKYIHEMNIPLKKKIVLFINSDEEIGSHLSRKYIEAEAHKSIAAFILEPPVTGTGALKTKRKGTANYLLTIKGVSAHAGNNPEDGVSAIIEAARQILKREELADYEDGTTLNIGKM